MNTKFIQPMTRNQANSKGVGVGLGYAHPFKKDQCAYGIPHRGQCACPRRQCLNKPGHGPDNLYCKRHAKEVRYAI